MAAPGLNPKRGEKPALRATGDLKSDADIGRVKERLLGPGVGQEPATGWSGVGRGWQGLVGVGRAGRPSYTERVVEMHGGSVGRDIRPEIFFAALRAAGRSVGRAESETRDFKIAGRSGDTQSLLSTSRRPTAGTVFSSYRITTSPGC